MDSNQKIIDSLEAKVDNLEDALSRSRQIADILNKKTEEQRRIIAAQTAIATLDARLMKLGYTGDGWS